MRKLAILLISMTVLLISCKTTQNTSQNINQTEITFLHLNDVYEISPLSNGKVAGMARVATVREELLKQNPNTITVLSGDFLSPSVIGTLKYEGKTIAGKQMVEVMNALGVDWVCFGNHEFDLKEADLISRINESKFNWLNTNAWYVKGNQTINFSKHVNGAEQEFLRTKIFEFEGVKVGMFGVVLPSNKKSFVAYDDFFESAKKAYNELKTQCDFVVALTHLNKVDDRKLAEMLPDVKILLGGHDHDNMYEKIGNVVLAKADANAKTVYIHRILFDKKTKKVSIKSELKPIDDKITDNQAVGAVVKKWENIMDNSLKSAGIDKSDVIYDTKTPLDGRESSVRNFPTNLTDMITKSMSMGSPTTECAIFNGGSIRIDDQLEGKITQLDIVRTLPFGGKIAEVVMKGVLLEQILKVGLTNKGNGGFLHYNNIKYNSNTQTFEVSNKLLDVNQDYKVVLPEFLLTGQETGLSFLNRQNPNISNIKDTFDASDNRNDIRKILITYMKTL